MGRFIITRTAAGVCFVLQGENGRALAHSKRYASLDACKKSIRSLMHYAPCCLVVDATAGQGGPNPKIEITREPKGLYYTVKAANGKDILSQGPFATRKACLRAVTLLQKGVLQADAVLANSTRRISF